MTRPRSPRLAARILGCAATFTLLVLLALWLAGPAAAADRADPGVVEAVQIDVGPAVLAYERARLAAPRDAQLAEGLAALRRDAGLAPPETSLLERWAGRLSLDEWAWLGLGALLVLAVFTLGRGIAPAFPRLPRVAVVLLALVLLASGAGVGLGLASLDRAVLIDGDVALRISPFAAAETRTTLPAGSVVRVERAFADHVQVRTGDGRTGWAAAAQVVPVVPR